MGRGALGCGLWRCRGVLPWALPEGGRAQGLAKGPTVAHLWPLGHKLRMYMWGAGAAVYRQADNKNTRIGLHGNAPHQVDKIKSPCLG